MLYSIIARKSLQIKWPLADFVINRLFILTSLCALPITSYSTYHLEYQKPNQEASYYLDFFLDGQTSLYFRGRHAYATDESNQTVLQPTPLLQPLAHEHGRATTLSSRLKFTTAHICQIWGLAEFNNVSSYWNSRHNSGQFINPEKARFAEIPDPKGTSLNQALLVYQAPYQNKIMIGRQRINLDNGRFVGTVDFRQTPQTFDAVSIENRTFTGLQLFYAYVDRVNTNWQNNDNALDGRRGQNTHLINASYEFYPLGTFTGYFYYLHDQAVPAYSNHVYGFRYDGFIDLQKAKLLFTGEYAYQADNRSNPLDYNAEYYLVESAFEHPKFKFGAGYEWLEGNQNTPGKSFITPLSDYHQHNGWCDRFRITPQLGLTDFYVFTKADIYHLEFEAAYHRFHAEASSIKYGHEIDFGLSYRFFKFYKATAAYADFSGNLASGFGSSKQFWLSLSAEIG